MCSSNVVLGSCIVFYDQNIPIEKVLSQKTDEKNSKLAKNIKNIKLQGGQPQFLRIFCQNT